MLSLDAGVVKKNEMARSVLKVHLHAASSDYVRRIRQDAKNHPELSKPNRVNTICAAWIIVALVVEPNRAAAYVTQPQHQAINVLHWSLMQYVPAVVVHTLGKVQQLWKS